MSGCPELLVAWVERQVPLHAQRWLAERIAAVGVDAGALGPAMSLVPRRLGKAPLDLSADDLAAAERARAGWMPAGWGVDQAARVALLLNAEGTPDAFVARLRTLASTADNGELIAIHKGLPLYRDQANLVPLAAGGLRTAMREVFEAVAHNNPFPAEHFPVEVWNHMVLKALFIESALHPIVGLDRRWNEDLARTLLAYAHERWAAGRSVSSELWRGVGRFADADALADLARMLRTGTELERMTAALALSENEGEDAARLLASQPALAGAVAAGRVGWAALRGGHDHG